MKKLPPLCVPELRKLSIAMENTASKLLKDLGLTPTQGIAIFQILEHQERGYEPMSQRDLERLMGISNPAAAGIVTRLEAKGFVRRVKLGQDMRYNYLEPTEQSAALRDQLYPHLLENEDVLFTGFSREERELFLQFIGRMLKNAADAS